MGHENNETSQRPWLRWTPIKRQDLDSEYRFGKPVPVSATSDEEVWEEITFGNGEATFKANDNVKLVKMNPTFYGKIKHFRTKVCVSTPLLGKLARRRLKKQTHTSALSARELENGRPPGNPCAALRDLRQAKVISGSVRIVAGRCCVAIVCSSHGTGERRPFPGNIENVRKVEPPISTGLKA